MNLHLSLEGIGLIIAILLHGAASIWWASRMDSTVNHINTTLITLAKEMKDQTAALWKRVDELRDMIK